MAEIQTPAYKGPSVRGSVARKKHVDGMMQRGLFVKRVVHAVAVETTTHPVVRRHVKNNMVPALLSSHCCPDGKPLHELHEQLAERISFAAALRISRGARQRGGDRSGENPAGAGHEQCALDVHNDPLGRRYAGLYP